MEDSQNKNADTGLNRRDLFKTGLVLAGGAMLPAGCKTSATAAGGNTTFITHILLGFFLLISACSSSQSKDINAKVDSSIDPHKILIVYLSRTNNTKVIAEIIHSNVGGKLVALELEKPYPENYQARYNRW